VRRHSYPSCEDGQEAFEAVIVGEWTTVPEQLPIADKGSPGGATNCA
jgi:hypothetical protein